jgi:hypothetical protein
MMRAPLPCHEEWWRAWWLRLPWLTRGWVLPRALLKVSGPQLGMSGDDLPNNHRH